ncbi:hypothetical protein SRHO_G00297830 [Serrasalmus rhombeus]
MSWPPACQRFGREAGFQRDTELRKVSLLNTASAETADNVPELRYLRDDFSKWKVKRPERSSLSLERTETKVISFYSYTPSRAAIPKAYVPWW